MKYKKYILLMIISIFAFLIFAPTSFSAEKVEYKWKIANYLIREQMDQNLQLFCDLVNTYSDGRMEIELFTYGILGDHDEMFHGIQDGSIEMAMVAPYVHLVPGGMLFWMPWSVENYKQLAIAFENPNGILYKVGLKALEEVGLQFIYDIYDGPYGLANNVRPIITPDDLRNLKLRVSGSVGFVRALENMGKGTGLTLHTIPFSEVYNSLERGVIDGCWFVWPSLIDEKEHEVVKYATALDWSWGVNAVSVNKEKWDSLPDELQDAIIRAGNVARIESYENGVRLDQKFINTVLNETDVEVYFPTQEERTAFREKANMPEIWNELCKPWLDKAFPGENMTEQIINELDRITKEY